MNTVTIIWCAILTLVFIAHIIHDMGVEKRVSYLERKQDAKR
jgi:hypothetical protein